MSACLNLVMVLFIFYCHVSLGILTHNVMYFGRFELTVILRRDDW
jgi:hypothetical protein